MALLSLCACARSATHDMIETHTTVVAFKSAGV